MGYLSLGGSSQSNIKTSNKVPMPKIKLGIRDIGKLDNGVWCNQVSCYS